MTGGASRRARSRWTAVALGAVVLMALLLRLFNVGHVLSYDEAWNSNSIIALADGVPEDVFYDNIFRHPPFYTGIGALYAVATGSGRFGVSIFLQVMSLLFSLGIVITLFACGREWFDARTGLAAAFFFAVMPAARVYDTWVKQESLTLLLCLLFLLFFFRRRYVVAGLILGLCALTKEVFVFVPAALLIHQLVTGTKDELRGFAIAAAIGAAISAWWYLLYSSTSGAFLDFFLGRGAEAFNWSRPWYFYLRRMPEDVGWVCLLLAGAGAATALLRLRSNWPGRGAEVSESKALLALMWASLAYLVLTLSVGKPPWMVYTALPAFALLSGYGTSEVMGALEGRWRYVFAAAVLSAALLLSLPVGYGGFMKRADPTFERAVIHKEVAEYVNSRAGPGGKVVLKLNDLSPNIAFYLELYHPGSITAVVSAESPGGPDDGYSMFLLSRGAGADEMIAGTSKAGADYLLLRMGSRDERGNNTAEELSETVPPHIIGNMLVFDGPALTAEGAGDRNR